MVFDKFSRNFRVKAHKCLHLCGLEVDSPDGVAHNVWLNIVDIIVSMFYYGANIICLLIERVELFVLFLNMLCLIQAFIRTFIKRKDCGKRLIGIQMNENSSGLYCPPYTGLVILEVFVFGMDFFGALVLLGIVSLEQNLIIPLKVVISITIFLTFCDGLISNIENMYPAHPRIMAEPNT